MKIYLMIIFAFFVVAQSSAQCTKGKKTRPMKTMTNYDVKVENLPDGAKLDDKVRVNKLNDDGVIIAVDLITVEEKLRRIGAKYIDNKLVDKNGKEIRFYRSPLRGASQGFEEDKKQAEIDAKELAELKEKYTVVEIFVNPLEVM